MNIPDQIRAIGFTARLQRPGAEAPEPCDESACVELRAALPSHVSVKQTKTGCLLEWSPAARLERDAEQPIWAFKARLRVLLSQAEAEVSAALPPRPEGEPAWALAAYSDGRVDAYAIGRMRGIDKDVFLVFDDDE